MSVTPIIIRDADLAKMNTFGMKVSCACLFEWSSPSELAECNNLPRPLLCIGGGSNLLFTKDFDGTLIHSLMRGINVIGEDGDDVDVQVASGEKWDDFCGWAADNGLWGVENLSGIPGDAGAAVVQNIGAYGCEVADVMQAAYCFDIQTGTYLTITRADADYAYRDSMFKNSGKGRYIVISAVFRLKRCYSPNLSYKALSRALASADIQEPYTPSGIREVVLDVRNSKLPDPAVIGSAGSFFRNPYVELNILDNIRKVAEAEGFGEVPFFDEGDGRYKVPAAWMIDKCGWKGRRMGNAGVYEGQPLVLVNATGEATPDEILTLENAIVKSVREKFGVTLIPEVEHI